MPVKWETRLWKAAETAATRRGYTITSQCRRSLLDRMRKNAPELRGEKSVRLAERNLKRLVDSMAAAQEAAAARDSFREIIPPTAPFGAGAGAGRYAIRGAAYGREDPRPRPRAKMLGRAHLSEALKSLCPIFPIC